MATFHPFSRLPPELRLQIWEAAAFQEPRHVHLKMHSIRVKDDDGAPRPGDHVISHLTSPATVPGFLQACAEARGHILSSAIYTRSFAHDTESESYYILVNFAIDAFGFSLGRLSSYSHVPDMQRIRHLRLHYSRYSDFPRDIFRVADLEALATLHIRVGMLISYRGLRWCSILLDAKERWGSRSELPKLTMTDAAGDLITWDNLDAQLERFRREQAESDRAFGAMLDEARLRLDGPA